MKNHLRQLIILFLTGFALLGQSCVEEERLPRPAFPADVTNRYALLLQEHLQADGVAYDRYAEILAGRTPVYEEVRFTTHSTYGLCYIIPYCSSSGGTIKGAVYLPVGATCTEEGTVTFDSSLGTPVNMDAHAINRDAPFTERYTYSMPFKHLQAEAGKSTPTCSSMPTYWTTKASPSPPKISRTSSYIRKQPQIYWKFVCTMSPNMSEEGQMPS